jgi:peptidoglycan/LPS O-acetylase OafA/YrhL
MHNDSVAELPGSLRLARLLLWAHAGGTLCYWLAFASRPEIRLTEDATYLAFERAFPLADAWMASCAVLGAHALGRRRARAVPFALLAAGAMGFLALLDFSFALQHQMYERWRLANVVHLGVVVASAALAAGIPLLVWRSRNALSD